MSTRRCCTKISCSSENNIHLKPCISHKLFYEVTCACDAMRGHCAFIFLLLQRILFLFLFQNEDIWKPLLCVHKAYYFSFSHASVVAPNEMNLNDLFFEIELFLNNLTVFYIVEHIYMDNIYTESFVCLLF